jgi:hypothetical protein
MIIKLWTAVGKILDGGKAHKVVSKLFGNVASDMVIISLSKYLKTLDKPKLESLRDRLKDVKSIKEVKMGELCVKCKRKIVGAAQLTPEGFIHILACPTGLQEEKEEKEESDMGKKKDANKAKKVEKKVVKKTAAKKEPKPKDDRPKISAIVYDGIKAKQEYEEIEKAVKKVHPESKFNKKHYSWYANQYEKIKK